MILYLTLKSKWYDMISVGEKLEEYRDVKPFWVKRLCNQHNGCIGGDLMDKHKVIAYTFKPFTHVCFARGGHFHQSLPQMILPIDEISIGIGKVEWGADLDKKYFIIKLRNQHNSKP